MSGKDTTYESRVMSTLYNPFSLKNLDPKWPDGLCTSSTGIQLRRTSEINGSEIIIALVPGLVNWCFAYTWDEQNNVPVIMMNHADTMSVLSVYETNMLLNILDQPVVTIGNSTSIADMAAQPSQPIYSSWRGVSYGMRMMNVNTDHDNDGWFECVRTTRNVFLNRLGIALRLPTGADITNDSGISPISLGQREKDNIYVKPGCIFPLTETAQEWFSARNWALMPSYASGKLKELKDFVFTLNPEKTHNDFIPMQFTPIKAYSQGNLGGPNKLWIKYLTYNTTSYTDEFVTIDGLTAPNDNWRVYGMPTEDEDALNSDTFQQWTDLQKGFSSENFDMILVKIHGLANTKTVVSSVANLEFQLNERTNIGHHHLTNSYACIDALNRYLENTTMYKRQPFTDTSKNKF